MENSFHISEEESALIERFLFEEMTAEESAAFAARLESDAGLNQKVKMMSLLATGIGEAGLEAKLEEFHAGMKEKRSPAQVFSFKTWLAAASVILIAITAVYIFTGRHTADEKLYYAYYSPDPGLITAMGNAEDAYVFQKAMVDYKSGAVKNALHAWDALVKQNPSSDTLNYFVGAAWLKLNKPDSAVSYLQKTASMENSAFYSDACWYLGLALLYEGRNAEAIDVLRKSSHESRDILIASIEKNRVP